MDLETFLPRRVTVVSAPARFGKTSHVARLARRPGTVWASGADAVVADTRIAAGLGLTGGSPRSVLVIDDCHRLPPGSATVQKVQDVIDHGGPETRIVLVGRPPLPFRATGRLPGGVATITERELALSPAAVGDLVTRELGPGHGSLGAEVHDLTRGWPGLVAGVLEELGTRPVTGGAGKLRQTLRARHALQPLVDAAVLTELPEEERQLLLLVAQFGAERGVAGFGLSGATNGLVARRSCGGTTPMATWCVWRRRWARRSLMPSRRPTR